MTYPVAACRGKRIPFTLADPLPGELFDVTDYGATGDGQTDDTAAINATIAAAVAAGGTVYFPAPDFYVHGGGTIAEDAYLYGPGATISCSGSLRPLDNVTIRDMTIHSPSNTRCIAIGETGPTLISGVHLRELTLTGDLSWAAIMLFLANDCIIEHCDIQGTLASGSGIQVLGGKRNIIRYNTTVGGVTGIAFLYSRGANGGGLASLLEDNEVYGNTVSGYSEEGITFDVIGNTDSDVAAIEYDAITAVDTNEVTLSSPASAFANLVGYDMVFLDGTLQGNHRKIVAQSGLKNNTFTLDSAGAQVGDLVVVGATIKRNKIHHNTVTAPGHTNSAILLYGMCFENEIYSNIIPRGIVKVESLDNTVVADISVVGAEGRCPCGYNLVQNNALADGNLILEYYHLAPPNYAVFQSKGNNVIGNSVVAGHLIVANEQHAWFDGNTGTEDFTNVVEAIALMEPDDEVVPEVPPSPSQFRLYIGTAAGPYAPATKRGGWENSAATGLYSLLTAKAGAVTDYDTKTVNNADADYDFLSWRATLVLTARMDFSGQIFRGVFGTWESNAALNAVLKLHAFILQGQSDTLRCTLINEHIDTGEFGTDPATAGNAFTGEMGEGLIGEIGDVICVEAGSRSDADAITYTQRIYYGAINNADLAAGGNIGTNPAWIEFDYLTPA